MICPLRLSGFGGLSNFEEEPFGCQKEKCAWWIEKKEHIPIQNETGIQYSLTDISSCAIRLMAERGK